MNFNKTVSQARKISLTEVERLQEIQKQFAQYVILKNSFQSPPQFVVGIDLAFKDEHAITAGVVMTFPELQKVTSRVSTHKLNFPYIPGLLAFREGPSILEMIQSLAQYAQLVLVNAHGIAHPRFCGCASHVGILAAVPTIGVASHILCGDYNSEPMSNKNCPAPLMFQNRQVGWVLRSHPKSNPIVISPGHKIDILSCLNLIKICICTHKLPEPLQLAHQITINERDAHTRLNGRLGERTIISC